MKKVKVISNPERKSIYQEDQEEGKLLDLDAIRTQISNSKYFMDSLDWVNLVQSIHELKLYVSYLLLKDKYLDGSFAESYLNNRSKNLEIQDSK